MNYIRFEFKFNPELIKDELQAIAASFNPIYSLKIQKDQLNGIHLIRPNLEGNKNNKGYTYCSTSELDKSPYLQSILNTFECDKLVYRVHNLRAKGKIELHRDLGRGLANKIVRVHIPVTTNEEVYFYVNGERINMDNGECWFADITQLHEVENRSESDRLQLMIDCDLNDWWKNILKKHGVEIEEPDDWKTYSLEDLKMMKKNILMMGDGFDPEILESIDLAIAEKIEK